MNYSQIALLFMQGTLVALVILFLFHLRKQLGIGVMFACLGLFQFVQLFLYSTVSVSITDSFFVSPGSVVYFTASLFVILMVYIKEDINETKKLIYALFIVNIVMTILVQALNLHFSNTSIQGTFNASVNLFDISLWELFIGTLVLFLDAFLIIILFEYISNRIEFLFLRICVTMLIVISFDTLFFVTLNFWGVDNLGSIIKSGLISKGVFTVFYSTLLYLYLNFFDLNKPLTGVFKIKDVFKPLTYKQKFESAEKVIQETTEMYRLLTEHSKDMIFLHEPDTTFKYISPSIKKLLGYEQSELIGKQVFNFVYKDDVKLIRQVLEKKLFSKWGVSDAIPFRIRHKSGHYVWLEFLSSPVYEGDKISYYVTTARDITQRVLAEQKVKLSLEQLEKKEHSLSEASKIAKIGYWEYDIATGTFTWSDYMYKMYGINPEDEIPSQEKITSFYDKKSQQKIAQVIKDISVKGVSCDVELRFINLKNEVVWERTVAKSVYNEQNEIVGRVGVMQDITAFKRAQFEQELSKQKIQTSLELLEKKDYSLSETSRIAKIGYWEYNIASDTFIWSDYVYEIYGLDVNEDIPSRKDMVTFYDAESQKKLKQATIDLDSKGIPYDIELKLINTKKQEVWVRNVVQLVYNERKEIIGRRGLVHNITSNKNAQLEIELSKQKIQDALQLSEKRKYSMNEASKVAKIGYWEHDLLTDTVVWSDYMYRIFGVNPKEGIPLEAEIVKNFNKASQEKLTKATVALTTKGVSYDIELKYITANKEEFWIRNVAQPIYNNKNKVVGKRGVLQNITEQKIRQKTLDRQSEKLYELNNALNQAQKLSHVGSWYWEMETDTAEWSDEMYNMYGVTKESFYPSNKNVSNCVLPEDLYKLEQGINSLLIDKKFLPFEFRIRRPSGEIRNLYIVALENKYSKGFFGVTMDITDRKKIEKEHLRIKENYRRLFDNATVSIWNEDFTLVFKQLDALRKQQIPNIITYLEQHPEVLFSLLDKLIINSVNEATLKLYKVKNQQEFLHSFQNTLGTGAYKVFLKLIEAIWNRKKIFLSEVNFKTLKGDEFAALMSIPIPQTEMEQKTVPVSIQSIQSIKDAESAKRESLIRLKEAQQLAQVGSWSFNTKTKESKWSDETFRIWGFDKEKQGVPSQIEFYNRIHKEDQEYFNNAATLVVNNGIPYDIEFRICLPNKQEKYIRSICTPIFSENGEVVSLKGTNQDITVKKQIEEKNLIITKRYRNIFDYTTVSIWDGDLSGVLEQLSVLRKLKIPNFKLYLEEHPEVLFSLLDTVVINKVNKATVKLFKAESEKKFLEENIQNTFASNAYKVFGDFMVSIWNKEKTFTSEVNYKTLTGEEFAAIVSIPIPQTEIEWKNVPVSIQSIQSVKDAESEKRESLNKLKEAQELAHVGSWSYNLSMKELEWSDETFRIWGFEIGNTAPDEDAILNRIHKDDLEFFNNTETLVYTKGIPYDIEFRICLPNNVVKTIRSICKPIFGENSEVVSLKGTNQDITEQKRIRREIEKAEEMYRVLTDNSNDLISLHELDSTFKYISPSIKNLLGYEQHELLGQRIFKIIHKDDIKSLLDVFEKRKLSDLYINPFSCRVLHKQGHYIWLEFVSSPVYKNKEIIHFISSARDVTQWVLAKQEIEEYQTSLQKLTTEMTLIEEKQKKEIATNIHDHLSQSLVISKMKINELKKRPQLKPIDNDLKFIETHISEALENSRKITYELSPPVLYQLGIIEALNWLLDYVETTHKIKCVVNSNVDSIKLNEVKSILLYRSIQEVVTNAIKYANASLITLDLDKNKFGIDIFITDDGVGFDTSILNKHHNHSSSGFGLFTVQERIRNIQGKFAIKSKINVGTIVEIFIPLTK